MIVVDLGCAPRGDDLSVEPLVDEYRPELLFAFDPWPGLAEGVDCIDGTTVVTSRRAAWTTDGTIAYVEDGLRSRVEPSDHASEQVACFDLWRWVAVLPEPPLVKFDVEGAEYPLLEQLLRQPPGLAEALLVEWHDAGEDGRRAALVRSLELVGYRVGPW